MSASAWTPVDETAAKWTPVTETPKENPGFWSTLGEDIKGLLHPSAQNPYPGMGQEEKTATAAQAGQEGEARKDAGYSLPYRTLAPVAESLGVNVPGMEQSARAGDVGGVAGHAAAPLTVLGAGEALAHGGAAAVD